MEESVTVFKGFFRFYCTKKTAHKITTQEEHHIYTILPVCSYNVRRTAKMSEQRQLLDILFQHNV